ncbi:1932_t:CDS:10 [Acaulospora colombiana]|uniref:1932_t:CDS:1 n=1 Tax=Acaulospora colombiana TaxID=27376 RepID=A0ACA9LC74_9GLOM|nr:1932_t:CDS:10 [Acaulospora colombiana]
MRLTKPSWLAHLDDKNQKTSIFSIHVHPDGTRLATGGLETNIFLVELEKLHKLEQHQGFVKGVTWDPVGEFLATENHIVYHIYLVLLGSLDLTSFQLISWSPDGSHVATANGAQGPIPIAAIFGRGKWRTDVSLVGHESAIEVVAFNPVLFMIPESDDADAPAKLGSVCAVGSQDHTISVWVTRNARPLFVCQKPFAHTVLDLAWSPDGTHLYACSYDGTVVVLQFNLNEFGERVSNEELEKHIMKYGFKAKEPIILENTTQLDLENENAIAKRNEKSDRMSGMVPMETSTVGISNASVTKNSAIEPMITNFDSPENAPQLSKDGPLPMNVVESSTSASSSAFTKAGDQPKVSFTREGKKRIQPQFLGGLNSTSSTIPASSISGSASLNASNMIHSTQQTTSGEGTSGEMEPPSRALPPGGIPALIVGNKRKDSGPPDITSSNKRMNVSGKSNSEVESNVLRPAMVSPSVVMSQIRLASYKVREHLTKDKLDGATLKLECHNNNNGKRMTFFFFFEEIGIVIVLTDAYFENLGLSHLVCTRGKSLQPTVSIVTACVRSNGTPLLVTSRYTLPNPSGQESSGDVTGNCLLENLDNYSRQRSQNVGSLSHLRRPPGPENSGQHCNLLGFLQNQLLVAELINSPAEYKRLLFSYAQQLADEGSELRVHELSSNRDLQRLVTEYKSELNKILNLD